MLLASLREDHLLWQWRDYIAENLWAVGKLQLADPDKYPFPSWMEFTQDGETPARTGEDIRNELILRWGGGG